MKYSEIRSFDQRCEEHPDHQSGMITYQMLLDRAHEEIDELREFIESQPNLACKSVQNRLATQWGFVKVAKV